MMVKTKRIELHQYQGMAGWCLHSAMRASQPGHGRGPVGVLPKFAR